MDFVRKDIHTSVLKESKYSQITIDDDFNLPDNKEDIEKIIAKAGNVIVDEVEIDYGKVHVSGVVCFTVLYQTKGEQAGIGSYEGAIPFHDSINVDSTTKNSMVTNRSRLEDLTINMINSRKIEVRGLLGNSVQSYEEYRTKAATELENGQGVESKFKRQQLTELIVAKHDMFRLKEELEIPQNKPNINSILWSSVSLRNMETKVLDGKISIRGEVECFVIYQGFGDDNLVQYLYSVRTINKELECIEATEDMVLEATCSLGKGETGVRQDSDGEDRVIGVDYCVQLGIKLYKDNEVNLIADLYSPQVEIMPDIETIPYENLWMHNLAKAKINERRHRKDEQEQILQICHTYGDVEIDDVEVFEDSVKVIGVVKANILYIANDDSPIKCMEEILPFEYKIDIGSLPKDASVRVDANLDLLVTTLLSAEDYEIKAQVNLDMCVFMQTELEVVTDMKIEPIDYEKKSHMPGIIGYIVQPEDTLWSIARKYYATTESIRKLNHLEDDIVREGDRLIIVKS